MNNRLMLSDADQVLIDADLNACAGVLHCACAALLCVGRGTQLTIFCQYHTMQLMIWKRSASVSLWPPMTCRRRRCCCCRLVAALAELVLCNKYIGRTCAYRWGFLRRASQTNQQHVNNHNRFKILTVSARRRLCRSDGRCCPRSRSLSDCCCVLAPP